MNLTEHITPGGPLLEVLRRAEASLRDEPCEFMDWTRCTCGHVYTATTGRRPKRWSTTVSTSADVTFLQVVRYILNTTGGPGFGNSIDALSSRTIHAAESNRPNLGDDEDLENQELRAAALQLIRTAIAKCEAEQLAAMHAVADEAQRVVSLVDVQESVTA